MKLAREMQADYEIDDFDVAQVERTAEDRRGFEAVAKVVTAGLGNESRQRASKQ